MPEQIKAVKCTHVVAQVSLGFYDADGNLLGEETFPQGDGGVLVARIFHPHAEQLTSLIESCVAQAWAKLDVRGQSAEAPHGDAEKRRNEALVTDGAASDGALR